MKVARTPSELSSLLDDVRCGGSSIGFVPTMGALHQGHLSLVQRACQENDVSVVSIFVNPLQFGPTEDLDAYPRDVTGDSAMLEAEGTSVLFFPIASDIHPPDRATTVSVSGINGVLEGAHRPGHFDGVCTVVAKLFNLVGADRAYFGQKDAQQVAVLKRMAIDLGFSTEIVVCPILREADGLAMSSRNAYLSPVERKRATVLNRALQAGAPLATRGDFAGAETTMMNILNSEEGVVPDYAKVVDPDTFGVPAGERVLLAVAAKVGPARLIDNHLLTDSQ